VNQAMSNLSFCVDDGVWAAVLKRDRRSDGNFVYAAITTGIYCRPSCPARTPRRRNARIFSDAEEAERHGYAACRRCYPKSLTPAEQGIAATLEYIEAHPDEAVTLNTLSRMSGFSPHHLRETFARIVGVTPKEFRDARRMVRFKELLKAGQSISAACYAAGYGSSRALYETAHQWLGMTPAEYQRGACGVRIHYAVTRSMLGPVLIGCTEVGVCAVLVGESDEGLKLDLRQEFPCATIRREDPRRWAAVIETHQIEDALLRKLPLFLRRRIFQARVWKHIQ
jgi:AraC family transcriptional regulator of adaptative response/methylated-DNA-[protein]-cysteine methyltransferase